jgi:hypothetical protein
MMSLASLADYGGAAVANAMISQLADDTCLRMRVAPEQWTRSFEGRGIRLDTLKNRIKADMVRAADPAALL